jgi:hypothetical protein
MYAILIFIRDNIIIDNLIKQYLYKEYNYIISFN